MESHCRIQNLICKYSKSKCMHLFQESLWSTKDVVCPKNSEKRKTRKEFSRFRFDHDGNTVVSTLVPPLVLCRVRTHKSDGNKGRLDVFLCMEGCRSAAFTIYYCLLLGRDSTPAQRFITARLSLSNS